MVSLLHTSLALLLVASGRGQAPTQPAPKPEDVASLDSIMRALYDVISGPIGQKRDWDRMRSLFAPNARMGAAVRTKAGDIKYYSFDVDRYITNNDPYMLEHGFYEKERHRKMDTFGNITQVFSSYESRWKPDDKKPFERGINALQFVNDGKRWWITSILWQGEDDKLKLPRAW